jgi:D-serine dehydratase
VRVNPGNIRFVLKRLFEDSIFVLFRSNSKEICGFYHGTSVGVFGCINAFSFV